MISRKANEAIEILKKFKKDGTFPRADYKELLDLSLIYLTGEVDGVKLSQPGAAHEARFMATQLYTFKLVMTRKID